MNDKRPIGIIILAAGASSRMGEPKQRLAYKGQTLLQAIVSQAEALKAGPVIVVLGAHATEITSDIPDTPSVVNSRWEEGMAGSIRSGLVRVNEMDPGLRGVIIALSDQPLVTTSHLENLVTEHSQSGKPIVASAYEKTMGSPVFFERSVFSELMKLEGDKGAKSILVKDPSRVALVDFPEGSTDIDTAWDYARLTENE